MTSSLKTQFGPQILHSLYHFSKLVQMQLINLNCVVVQLNNMGVDFWNAERVLIKSQLEFTVSVVYSVFIRSNYQTTQQCLSSKSSL